MNPDSDSGRDEDQGRKFQINHKFQIKISVLEFGYCNLEFIWDLRFGIYFQN